MFPLYVILVYPSTDATSQVTAEPESQVYDLSEELRFFLSLNRKDTLSFEEVFDQINLSDTLESDHFRLPYWSDFELQNMGYSIKYQEFSPLTFGKELIDSSANFENALNVVFSSQLESEVIGINNDTMFLASAFYSNLSPRIFFNRKTLNPGEYLLKGLLFQELTIELDSYLGKSEVIAS